MWIKFGKPRVHPSDVILTGLPRSGTTLTCYLLNKLDNTVALHEPIQVHKLSDSDTKDRSCRTIRNYFKTTRKKLLKEKTVFSKHIGGETPSNTFGKSRNTSGLRQSLAESGEIKISKPLMKDFLFVVKHPAVFTAILTDLALYFRCFAVVRNPLAVLASWNSVSIKLNDGYLPMGERWNRPLSEALSKIPDRIDRQLHILSWFYETYHRTLPKRSILRYEDIVSSGGKALSVISPNASSLNEPLESKNKNELYDKALMLKLGERLLKEYGGWRSFYSAEDVQLLMR